MKVRIVCSQNVAFTDLFNLVESFLKRAKIGSKSSPEDCLREFLYVFTSDQIKEWKTFSNLLLSFHR